MASVKAMRNQHESMHSFVPGRVSVILPSYNYGHFLTAALDSVLAQSIPDLEIVAVDDGSVDDTEKIVQQYRGRIRYVYQENAGLSSARNTGIVRSTGEFLLFLDADDILGPNVLSKQLNFLLQNPHVNVAVCRNKLFRQTNSNGAPKSNGEWGLYQKSLNVHLCYFNIAPPHAYMLRRDVVIQTGFFDTELKACEDYDFWLRAAIQGNGPVFNDDGVVYYRKHPQSMSANERNQTLHDGLLHYKLAELLADNHQFPFKFRLEGILAFAAGALVTAERLKMQNSGNWLSMLNLVERRLQEERDLVKQGQTDWNVLLILFFLRAMDSLQKPNFRGLSLTKDIKQHIKHLTYFATGSSFIRATIGKLFTIPQNHDMATILERSEISHRFRQYVKKPWTASYLL
jgi:glycosyltransferase involved in cell wall biosynthesis